MIKCFHLNCDLEVFKNSNKCILHCKKDDWFTINEKNKRIWDEKIVNQFWKNIRKYIKCRKDNYTWIYYFDSFVFPDIDINILHKPTSKDNILIKDFYFWEKGTELKLKGLVFFPNCEFYNFYFYELILDSISFTNIKANRIKLQNIKVDSISFDDINYNCSIKLTNIKNTNCSFNNTQIGDLDLSNVKFENLSINNSSFDSASFYNIIINNGLFISSTINVIYDSVGVHITNKDTFSYLDMNVRKASRDYFRLLKNYFFDKKDYLNANEMYQKEMDSHLKETYNLFINNCENGFGNFENLIVALFGKYSSNFGQSWLLPIFWIIFTLFLNLYITSEENFFDLLKNIPQLLDEMARLLYIKDKENFGIIDLLFKIPIGLFIYQLTMSIKRKTKY
jgi:hypothetical protein